MPQLISLHEINNYLDKKGYDIYPFKTATGTYKVSLWRYDSFVSFGKYEYTDWKIAVEKTARAIYNKINKG